MNKLICGNWKMHHDHLQAVSTIQALSLRLQSVNLSKVDVVIHPPFVDLRSSQTVIEDRHVPVLLGAQNCHSEDNGAYTGEVSPAMLARLAVSYIIVGHSERRRLFHESDDDIAAKVPAVLRHGMIPIVCVGEDEQEREAGRTRERLESQVGSALSKVRKVNIPSVVFAYEPLWAIGSGNAATVDDAASARETIAQVVEHASHGTLREEAGLRVLYGGSVTPANAADFVKKGNVDGLLVGGASLLPESFAAIVEAVASVA
ncbi:MAG: triose-phosphate isomerase [Acidimicrobiales bacterium]